MALEQTGRSTRRAILASAAGGVAVLAASTLARPETARAIDPNDVALGATNVATDATRIENVANGNPVLQGYSAQGNAVLGESAGEGGIGVSGSATSVTGSGFGVLGESAAPDGAGVYGRGTATTGRAVGVSGDSASPDGIGVSGSATADSGGSVGVMGDSISPEGVGVFGSASATSGNNIGVIGVSESPEGIGVQGGADADTGSCFGVYGTTVSPDGTGVCGVSDSASGGTGVLGQANGEDSTGVSGYGGRYGVSGDASGTGVFGHSGGLTGVLGFAGLVDMGVPPPDPHPRTGVFGYSKLDATAIGVLGGTTVGTGVRGEATSGVGGSFSSTSGIALDVVGKARFSRAKRVTIGSGKSSLTVSLAGVTASSMVLAVLHSNRSGVYVRAVVPTTGAFTIYLNTAVTSSTYVAYFVIN